MSTTLPSPRPALDVLGPRPDDRRDIRTAEITRALAASSDEQESQRLRGELVEVNMSVATAITRRYQNRGIDAEDLRQVAYLALTKASQRFDPSCGHAFLSFCVPTIRGELRRHFRDHGWMVRPPRRLQELQQRLSKVQAQLAATRGGMPTERELADALGEELGEVTEALDCKGCFSPASLDTPATESGSAIGELIGQEGSELEAAEARVVLAALVRSLSERDRRIIRLRFFDGLTQREVADDIGVTQMQVSRLLSRIYRDLRVGMGVPASA